MKLYHWLGKEADPIPEFFYTPDPEIGFKHIDRLVLVTEQCPECEGTGKMSWTGMYGVLRSNEPCEKCGESGTVCVFRRLSSLKPGKYYDTLY